MTPPEFVVVGHVVRDLVPGGWRLGGTATFAGVQAQRLGVSVGIVTRVGPELSAGELPSGAEIAGRPSRSTTCFENIYEGGRRRQRVPARAECIAEEDVPAAWRSAPVALLGPVCGEVAAGFGETFRGGLVGVSAQGYLRRIDDHGRVRRRAWTGEAFWRGCRVLFVSREDLGGRREQAERWAAEVPLTVVTMDRDGARLHTAGRWREIGAFPVREVDPTGAGDVFAAAFLVRYDETNDEAESARFASAAAACSVEGVGIERTADREEIERRMRAHPEIELL